MCSAFGARSIMARVESNQHNGCCCYIAKYNAWQRATDACEVNVILASDFVNCHEKQRFPIGNR
jgi:hypothetical protein